MTEEQKKQIEANRKNGLLCACNQAVVPYGKEGEHGNVIILGTVHGYENCEPIRDWIRGLILKEINEHSQIAHAPPLVLGENY